MPWATNWHLFSAHVSRRRLNGFGRASVRLKALTGSLITLEGLMAATSGCRDITVEVTYMTNSHFFLSAYVSQRWLNGFGRAWARLKALNESLIKVGGLIAAISGSGDITV